MTRIFWDKYETAILVDAALMVINGEADKKNTVSKVSKSLRNRAKSMGLQIDDVFRNENGISIQMEIMIALLNNKQSSLRKAPKIFRSVVDIYHNDKSQYAMILNMAKSQCYEKKDITGVNRNMKDSLENEFFGWLSNKVPNYKISDFYMLYHDIDEFCTTQKLLDKSLFSVHNIDSINEIRQYVMDLTA